MSIKRMQACCASISNGMYEPHYLLHCAMWHSFPQSFMTVMLWCRELSCLSMTDSAAIMSGQLRFSQLHWQDSDMSGNAGDATLWPVSGTHGSV